MTNDTLRVYKGSSFLYSKFASEILELLLVIRQEGMPFILYETYRTPQRQRKLYKSKFSTNHEILMNPHVNGLAVDFLFDKRAVQVGGDSKTIQEIVERTLNEMSDTDERNEVYNIGTNLIPEAGSKVRTVEQDAGVLGSWLKLGKVIDRQFPNLVWGGNQNIKEGQLIGVDPPHVEFREAKNLIRSKVAIRQIRNRGAPGLGKV
jgi:hypothetical protein